MKVIAISGRKFRFVQNDIEYAHYLWTRAHLRSCRLEQVLRDVGERDESYVERIYAWLHEQPEFYSLIGGVILPAELPESQWSPMIAIETGKFLREISDAETRCAFMREAADAVVNFIRLSEAIRARREMNRGDLEGHGRIQQGDL